MSPLVRPPSWRFAAWWLVLLLLHVVCLGYYVGVAFVYRHLPKTALALQLRGNTIGIAERDFLKVACIHEVVAAIHSVYIALTIGGSLQQRRLVFYPKWRLVYQWITAKLVNERNHPRHNWVQPSLSNAPQNSSLASVGRLIVASSHRVGSVFFGKSGFFGVDFVYFDHVLFAREVVEISLQTYQAYRMSRVLSRLWLLRLYVALLVVNCWVMPLLHRVYNQRHRVRRFMSIICDVVLDIVSSMGISLFIFCVYVPQYNDPRFGGFPFHNWYNDEWFVRVVQEFQIMLVDSWVDMASRLVFAFGVLQGMDSLKDLLEASAVPYTNRRETIISSASIVPVPGATLAITARQKRLHYVVHCVLHYVGPVFFILWGVGILVTHVYAEAQRINHTCKLPLRPWLSTKPACSLVEIDCHELGVSGSADSLDVAWRVFDPALTAGLVIRHCSALSIPRSIELFTGLTSMKTYNSTITSWSHASGFTTASHSRLRALYLIRTNLTNGTLPPGLVRADFPPTFHSFFASTTNLKSLPEDLDRVWPKGISIAIEFASFTAIPDVVLRLNPGLLSLCHCPIESLPVRLFNIPTLRDLFLSYTAIRELPRNVTNPQAPLNSLFLEGTGISAFWSWIDVFVEHSFYMFLGLLNAHQTPFCAERDQILHGTRNHFSASENETKLAAFMDVSTPSRRAVMKKAVTCTSDFKTLFPLAMEDETSRIR